MVEYLTKFRILYLMNYSLWNEKKAISKTWKNSLQRHFHMVIYFCCAVFHVCEKALSIHFMV